MRRLNRSMSRALLACSVLAACAAAKVAVAQGAEPQKDGVQQAGLRQAGVQKEEARPVGEAWELRARYGIAYRTGSQGQQQPSYQGLTPNDLSLLGWGWFGYAGVHASFQREAFALYDSTTNERVAPGALIRFQAGPAGRLPLGPARLELTVGYALHQLPAFDVSSQVVFGTVTRHGLLVAPRVLVDVGPVTLEARADVPIPLALSTPAWAMSTRADKFSFSAGGGVRARLFSVDKLNFGLMLDVSYVTDSLKIVDGSGTEVAATQSLVRGGLSVDVWWRPPPPKPTLGGVIVKIVDAETSKPLEGASVTVEAQGQAQPLLPDANGLLSAKGIKQGPFSITASAAGYLPAEGSGTVIAGTDVPVELRLKKEPPKFGTVEIAVQEIDSKKPLADVAVTVNGQQVVTNAAGVATVKNVKPGPVAISATLERYQSADEAASVVAGKTTSVVVTLIPEKLRVPATITGLVRSTKGGAPIAADLSVPQMKIKTKANDKGAFSFRVEGGSYTVKISAPGYLTQTKELTVKDGDQAIFNIDLYPK